MADNVTVDNGTGTDYNVAGDKVTYSGDADQTVQLVRVVDVQGAEGSKTVGPVSDGAGLIIQGNQFHDDPDDGNPVKIGGVYRSSLPTAVASGDRTELLTDEYGRLRISNSDTVDVGIQSGNAVITLESPTGTAVVGNSGVYVQGHVAHDVADAGNPVKIGGRARDLTALSPVSAYNDRVDAAIDEYGIQAVTLMREGSFLANTNLTDSATLAGDGLIVQAASMVFNGTNWDRLRGTTAGVFTQGNVAHDVADAGNPIKLGGKAESTSPAAVADGDRVDAWFTTTGQLVTQPMLGNSSAIGTIEDLADGSSAATISGTVGVAPVVYNGSTWDRARGNTTGAFVQGHLAHDAVDAGNPIKVGGKANDSAPTQVANADRVDGWFDRRGALFTRLTDSAGAAIATGVQYIEDSAITANLGQGTLVVARRDDALSALTPAENDAVGLRVDANGALWVAHGTALPAGTANIGDVDVLTVPSPLSTAGNGTAATAHRVTIASDSTGVIGLAAGSNNIGDVDVLTLPASTNTIEVVGDVAQDVGVAGNPVLIGARASTAIPTAMSGDGDAVYPWANRNGALIVSTAPHVGLNADPFTLTSKTVQTTTTQTGSDVVTPTSGKKLVVTSMQLQVGGTTAGTVQVWFGANADTSYTRGTDLAIFDGEFAPSATLKPGVIMNGPWIASAADHEIHLTTSAAINPLTVTVWYYEV